MCEHMGVSRRTGKAIKEYLTTAVRNDMLVCNNNVCDGHFTILSKGGNPIELEIKESITIKKLKPS